VLDLESNIELRYFLKSLLREVVETLLLAVLIFLVLQVVIRNFRVDGHSMEPNLQNGQYLVVDKVSPALFGKYERGDVIVFISPQEPQKDFVKRIIALPGETVELRRGQIYVNNTLLEEAYIPYVDESSMATLTVPPAAYFVLGDNRSHSNDSRNWGILREEAIIGRAWFSYWPPSRWGGIPNNAPTVSNSVVSNTLYQSTAPVSP
jgi:signal peptidase I